MISMEKENLGIRLVLLCTYIGIFFIVHANGEITKKTNCDKYKLYTEIGCEPIYGENSTSCPVAYNCEKVFNRPMDKCYFKNTTYESSESVEYGCDHNCTCNNGLFSCTPCKCPSDDKSEPPAGCYYQYDVTSCCKTNTYCPGDKDIVPTCVNNDEVYKIGERFNYILNTQCTCSEKSNGTYNFACMKEECDFELDHMREFLERSAPIFHFFDNRCPHDWYRPSQDVAIINVNATSAIGELASGGHVCMYGNVTIPLGHKVEIVAKDLNQLHEAECSCTTPPLLTCISTPTMKFMLQPDLVIQMKSKLVESTLAAFIFDYE